MEHFINVVLEKHASFLGNLGVVKKYKATKASPIFKAKKALGIGLLGAGAVGYAVHKLNQPEPFNPNTVTQPKSSPQSY